MSDFIFRFDSALAEARRHGVSTGDDATSARFLLSSSRPWRQGTFALVGTRCSSSPLCHGGRKSSSCFSGSVSGTGTRSVLMNHISHETSDLIEVEMDVRLPGEEAYFTRKVLLRQRRPRPASTLRAFRNKTSSKKAWEPGCWNCGDVSHGRSYCPHPPKPKDFQARNPVNAPCVSSV